MKYLKINNLKIELLLFFQHFLYIRIFENLIGGSKLLTQIHINFRNFTQILTFCAKIQFIIKYNILIA